jgi:hypothetical protein
MEDWDKHLFYCVSEGGALGLLLGLHFAQRLVHLDDLDFISQP